MESRRRKSMETNSLFKYLERAKRLDNLIYKLGRVSPDLFGSSKVTPPFKRSSTKSSDSKSRLSSIDSGELSPYKQRLHKTKHNGGFKQNSLHEPAPIDQEVKRALKEYGLEHINYEKRPFERKRFNVFDKYFDINGEKEEAYFVEMVKKLYV